MKASDFTLNSDFLSVAQNASKEFTVHVGAGSLMPGEMSNQEFNFVSPTSNGSIDRIMIKKDSGEYWVGYHLDFYLEDRGLIVGALDILRPDKTNIQAKLVIWSNAAYETISYPNMTFKIKVASFKVPNVF